MNWEKMFSVGKKPLYFKPVGDSAHNTEFFILRKFNLLMFYPSRQWKYFKWKLEQVQQFHCEQGQGVKFM